MDLLQGVKDMEDHESMGDPIPNMDDMPMPSVDDLLKALDGMSGLSDVDKENLRQQLSGKQGIPAVGGGFQQFALLISLLLIIALIFVFFGYKLYKSLVEKERKREEKRKMKQMKKKK